MTDKTWLLYKTNAGKGSQPLGAVEAATPDQALAAFARDTSGCYLVEVDGSNVHVWRPG